MLYYYYMKRIPQLIWQPKNMIAIREKTVIERPQTGFHRPFLYFFAAGQIKNKPAD